MHPAATQPTAVGGAVLRPAAAIVPAPAVEPPLPLHTAAGAALVDWRWDSVCQRVNGVLLQGNQLLPFRWWLSHNRLELRTAIMQIRPLG